MKRLILALCLLPNAALAYSDASSFARDPSVETSGGGGGLYFTGSPRQHGLRCEACHIDGPTDVKLRLSALLDGEASPLFSGGYEPGALYEIEVGFEGADLQPEAGCEGMEDEPCNINGFAFEMLDAAGQPAGVLCPVAPVDDQEGCSACRVVRSAGTLVADNCSVLLADGFDSTAFRWHNGIQAYSFFWRAPVQDEGALFAYVSAVDGRGQEVEDGEITSYRNDGVASVRVGLSSPTVSAASGSSCRNLNGGAALWVLLLGFGWLRRFRGAR